MYDFSGKVALVTGAGGEFGVGHAIAKRLAQEGANVVVDDVTSNPYPGRRESVWAGIPDVVREIEALGRQAMGIVADVSDSAQVDDLVRQAMDRFGRIDILVNNAATWQGRDSVPVVELQEEEWDRVLGVNLKGTFLCSRAVAREMIRRGSGGKIINISSVLGKHGVARRAAYSSSKFAIIGSTQCLALELAAHHINVNAICPTTVDSERNDYDSDIQTREEATEEWRTQFIRRRSEEHPLGRVAQGSDIADTAAFLASSQSDYLTGLSINVTGGSVMT